MELSVRQMLGQKLIFGFHGTSMSEEFKALLRKYQVGNVILFLRNVESTVQVRRLCSEINALILESTGFPAFILIDQEGGMVSRLPQDAVNVPGAMAISATGKPANARLASEITIRQLRSIGANFNMAPVLDVNNNPRNPVIGIRSFGDDPDTVTRFGLRSIAPYAGSGVLCCAKHFPGHGDTAVDSHLGLPRVNKTLAELEDPELIPFRAAIKAGVPAIMISHVLYPNIEPDNVPCTMSRRIVTDLLKKQLGFEGLVLSDCMEMGAIQKYYGTPEGTVAAIKAGIDLVGISSSFELETRTAETVTEAAGNGELDLKELRESAEKILRYKQQLYTDVRSAGDEYESDCADARDMARAAISCLGGAPIPVGEKTFFCGCADYRVSGAANDVSNTAAFPGFMSRDFGAPGYVTDKDPDAGQIARAVELAENADSIVLGTCNAHLFRGQLELFRALYALGKPMAVAAMRNPYDLADLPEDVWRLAAYDYSADALLALERVFRGAPAAGKCPVKLEAAV